MATPRRLAAALVAAVRGWEWRSPTWERMRRDWMFTREVSLRTSCLGRGEERRRVSWRGKAGRKERRVKTNVVLDDTVNGRSATSKE